MIYFELDTICYTLSNMSRSTKGQHYDYNRLIDTLEYLGSNDCIETITFDDNLGVIKVNPKVDKDVLVVCAFQFNQTSTPIWKVKSNLGDFYQDILVLSIQDVIRPSIKTYDEKMLIGECIEFHNIYWKK